MKFVRCHGNQLFAEVKAVYIIECVCIELARFQLFHCNTGLSHIKWKKSIENRDSKLCFKMEDDLYGGYNDFNSAFNTDVSRFSWISSARFASFLIAVWDSRIWAMISSFSKLWRKPAMADGHLRYDEDDFQIVDEIKPSPVTC